MKRFLLFHQTDSCTMGTTAAGAYIGDFDRVEDVLADIPKLQKTTGVNNDIYLDILDTRDQTWHEHYFPAFSEDYSGGRLFEHYHRSLREIRAMFDTSLAPMLRYMLFGLDKYESSGGMRDFLHSFDTPEACIKALQAYANGDRVELSAEWGNLTSRNNLVLFDCATMHVMEVRWQDYGQPKAIYPDYQDFLQFETKSKPQ